MTDKDKTVPKKERAKRTTMGFKILQVVGDTYKDTDKTQRFVSLVETEKWIKKHAGDYAGMRLMIAHLKKEITIQVENKAVATLTEVAK
jgi:hypothetical protein